MEKRTAYDPSDAETRVVLFVLISALSIWSASVLVANHPLPTTDLGQWLMYSRVFLGQSIPEYRIDHAVSPLIPFMLAVVSVLTSMPVISTVIASAVVYAVLLSSAFLAVKCLFANNLAALLVVLLVGASQYFFLYMLAFGGLPQLTAMACMNYSIVGVCHVTAGHRRRGVLWIATSGLFVVLAHIPSAPVYFLLVAMSLALGGIASRWSVSTIMKLLAQSAAVPVLVFLFVVRESYEQQIQYATNTAGYYLRGIDTLGAAYMWDLALLLLLAIAVASLIGQTIRLVTGPHRLRFAVSILWIWLLIPIFFMLASHLVGVGTDYQRFVYYCIQPPLFALAFTLSQLFARLTSSTSKKAGREVETPRKPRYTPLVCVVAVSVFLLTELSVRSAKAFEQAVDYFSPAYGSDLLELVAWLSASGNYGTVVAPSLEEANWIEGISGIPTLFPNKFRLLYRPGLQERAIASDLISLGATSGIKQGSLLLINGGEDLESKYSSEALYVLQRGEYYEAFLLDDDMLTIFTALAGDLRALNLARDFVRGPSVPTSRSPWRESTSYSCARRNCEITVTKVKTLDASANTLTVEYQIIAGSGSLLRMAVLEIADPSQRDWAMWDMTLNRSDRVWLSSRPASIEVHRAGGDGEYKAGEVILWPAPANTATVNVPTRAGVPYLIAEYYASSRLGMKVSIGFFAEGMKAAADNGAEVLSVPELITDLNVQHIVAASSDITGQELYEHYFQKVYSNRSYVVYRTTQSDYLPVQ